jgi:hypothetical protein
MPQFGEVRVDFLTFTTGVSPNEANVTVAVSGLLRNPLFSLDVYGDITTSGNYNTVTGNITTNNGTISGAIGQFTTLTGGTAGFTTVTGTTVSGGIGNFGSGVFSNSLTVTGAATFDSTLQVDGVATFNDNIVMEGTSADAHELTLTCNPTSDVTVTLPDATTTIAGLAVAQSFTKAQRGDVVTLTDAATIAVDLSLGNNFAVQLGGNRTLGDPTNATAGQSGVIVITQDGTGSRTLAYAGTKWKFAGGTAPTLTTTASAVDVLAYYVESATRITVTSLLNVS